MGRASGQCQPVALGGFDEVVGQRRGAPLAHLQRERAEAQRAVCEARAKLRRALGPLLLAETPVEELLAAFERGACDPNHPEFEPLVGAFAERCESGSRNAYWGALLALRDVQVESAPGMLAPFQAAVVRCLDDFPAPAVRSTLQSLFATGEDDGWMERSTAHYERLGDVTGAAAQALARSGAELEVARQSADWSYDRKRAQHAQLCELAAAVLHRAPPEALAGPLQELVAVLGRRAAEQRLSEREAEHLRQTVAAARRAGQAQAVAPLAAALR